MRTVYLAQINNSYGNNAFLPYSVGLLWAYASRIPVISSSYQLGGLLYLREDLDAAVARIRDPDVLALSCYIWNWSYNMKLAQRIKQLHPGCLVVIGGPEAPNRSDGFFRDHQFIDVIAHGEGEDTFADLLVCLAMGGDLSEVEGISYASKDGSTIKTKARKRMSDLDSIPSPYLDGLFDQMIANDADISFHASQETNRGCPYSCTFCDWGSAVMSKVRQFSTERLVDEIDWFGKKGIDLIYNCDANYGILKRDMDLTRYMVAAKHRYGGYPNKFRAAYAKKSDDKVFEIATMLNNAGMNKGITLSMQSMDPHALEMVKRSNIRVDDFRGLLDRYRQAAIPTYTEMIVGLPGETLDGFANGLDQVLEAGQHDNISIYMCMLLKNSEMATQEQINQHGIMTKRVPILSLHGSTEPDPIPEMNDIVVSTRSMSYSEWKRANLLSVLVQALHCQGLTHIMARHARSQGMRYIDFYLRLLEEHRDDNTVLGEQIRAVEEEIIRVFDLDLAWNTGLERYGDVSWPLEERMFLAIQERIDQFFDQLKGVDPAIKAIQKAAVLTEHDRQHVTLLIDGHASMLLFGDDAARHARFSSSSYYSNDPVSYAREIVWYGRKASLTKKKIERVD